MILLFKEVAGFPGEQLALIKAGYNCCFLVFLQLQQSHLTRRGKNFPGITKLNKMLKRWNNLSRFICKNLMETWT
ncbi:hypothetical protein BGV40_12760 [Methanosarcina sp. Ant1]|nr:hypothetical protein BGV40_12760 [Methanosarcina sp. Ant1]